jgi:hypothetical protein
MLSGMGTVNLSQLKAAFNTDLGDQQNPLQTEKFHRQRRAQRLLLFRIAIHRDLALSCPPEAMSLPVPS